MEQDAGATDASRRRFPFLGQGVQVLTLLLGQRHPVLLLVHRFPSLLFFLPPFWCTTSVQLFNPRWTAIVYRCSFNYSIHAGRGTSRERGSAFLAKIRVPARAA